MWQSCSARLPHSHRIRVCLLLCWLLSRGNSAKQDSAGVLQPQQPLLAGCIRQQCITAPQSLTGKDFSLTNLAQQACCSCFDRAQRQLHSAQLTMDCCLQLCLYPAYSACRIGILIQWTHRRCPQPGWQKQSADLLRQQQAIIASQLPKAWLVKQSWTLLVQHLVMASASQLPWP